MFNPCLELGDLTASLGIISHLKWCDNTLRPDLLTDLLIEAAQVFVYLVYIIYTHEISFHIQRYRYRYVWLI